MADDIIIPKTFAGMHSARIMVLWRLSPIFQRKGWQCITGSESLWVVVQVKPKLQCRPKRVGDARNMEHLPSTDVCSKQNQPRLEVMCFANSNISGTGLPKPSGSHVTPLCAMECYGCQMKSYRTECLPVGFQSCFCLIPPCYVSIPFLGN